MEIIRMLPLLLTFGYNSVGGLGTGNTLYSDWPKLSWYKSTVVIYPNYIFIIPKSFHTQTHTPHRRIQMIL